MNPIKMDIETRKRETSFKTNHVLSASESASESASRKKKGGDPEAPFQSSIITIF